MNDVRSMIAAALVVAVAPTFMMASAVADDVTADGFISLRGARHKIKVPGASATVTSYTIDGAFVFRPAGRYNLQLNGSFQNFDTDDDVLGLDDSHVFAGDAHMFWGRPDVYTVGAFVSAAELDAFDLLNETVFGGGLEADIYGSNWTTSVQTGLYFGEENEDIFGLSGQIRLYATRFFSVEGSIAYGNVELNGFDSDLLGFGVEAEHLFEGTPVSVFGGAYYTDTDDLDVDVTSLSLGLRWNFASTDLLQRDRHGPSMRGSQKIIQLFSQ